VLRRRKSTFMCGIEDDARAVIDHLAQYLAAAQGLCAGPMISVCHGNTWGLCPTTSGGPC
jgi:hypothetical protein